MTQCDRILRHMRDVGGITQGDAYNEYGIMRLGARIWELRRQGYDIRREMVQSKNRYGEKVSFARYRLGGR